VCPSLEQGLDRVQSDVAYTVSAFRYGTLSRISCSFISMKYGGTVTCGQAHHFGASPVGLSPVSR